MANPSTVNATASGKEVIRRHYYDGVAESAVVIMQGIADHIMTTISILICERANLTDSIFHMIFYPDASGTGLYMLYNQSLVSKQTFIFNEKVAITNTDKIALVGESSGGTAGFDVWVTYIDQDWS